MAISLDVLNTTYSEQLPTLVNGLVRVNPLIKRILQNKQTPAVTGPFIIQPFALGSPARGVGVYLGDERLNLTRNRAIGNQRIEGHRIVVAVSIPVKDMIHATGDNAALSLVKQYPKLVQDLSSMDISSYLLTGVSTNHVFSTDALRGFLCINGTFSAGIGSGVTNGVLDFQPPANQSDAVLNVNKSTSIGHYNQFAEISSWSANGIARIRSLYRQCASYGVLSDAEPDLFLMDPDLFGNLELWSLDRVRVQVVEAKTETTHTLTLPGFKGLEYTHDLNMNRAAFTSTPATGATVAPSAGVGYMLSSKLINVHTWQAPKATPFEERIGDQEVVVSTMSQHWQIVFNNLPAHGAIVGGAT